MRSLRRWVDGNGVQLTVGECHDEVQCIATAMCGAAYMLHHIERQQHITETTTVRVSRQLKSDIKVPGNHNRTCIGDRGTRDQITNLRILMHKAREHQQPLYMCYVNFKTLSPMISSG